VDAQLDAEGVELFPDDRRVVWRLRAAPPHVSHLRLGDSPIVLQAEADTGGGIAVVVEADQPFQLEIETEFTTYLEQVPAGRTRYLLTVLDRTDVREV